QLISADAVREARVIPDHGAVARLAAGDGFLQHDRAEAFRRRVKGGREAGRPGPDDDDIAFVDVAGYAAADCPDDLSGLRLDERVVVVADHDRQAGRGPA